MQEIKVDARGRSCPEPVMMAQNAFQQLSSGEEKVIIHVDSPVAMENIKRLAERYRYAVSVEKDGKEFYLTVTVKNNA
ncbi:MAG: sulfurtransferase TusA family protein [Dethiobacteria bacterium]|jgi:tRNA 2-thiouridine synthesizing protein A|nr:preprotein translocase subunit TatB [Bacillota bacterium]